MPPSSLPTPDPVRTLVRWNPGATALGAFWHAAAAQARVLAIDEIGPVCRIALRPPRGVRMASLVPPDIALLEHHGDPARLADALTRLAGGAAGLVVLSADSVADPKLFAAAVAALRPGVVALGPEVATAAADGLTWPSLPGCRFRATGPRRPALEGWLAAHDSGWARRRGRSSRLRIDEVAALGVYPVDPDAALAFAWTGPQRRASLLLPGRGGGAVRLSLRLLAARIPLDDDHVRLVVDGGEAVCRCQADRIEAMAILQDGPVHVLHIFQAPLVPMADGRLVGLALVGVDITPV